MFQFGLLLQRIIRVLQAIQRGFYFFFPLLLVHFFLPDQQAPARSHHIFKPGHNAKQQKNYGQPRASVKSFIKKKAKTKTAARKKGGAA